jgi:hypothetical protein
MTAATFVGEVRHGRLLFAEPLAAFEGQRVLVTVVAPDPPHGAGAAEPPDDLDVEVDVIIPMPPVTDRLAGREVRDRVAAPPCVILPEGADDA